MGRSRAQAASSLAPARSIAPSASRSSAKPSIAIEVVAERRSIDEDARSLPGGSERGRVERPKLVARRICSGATKTGARGHCVPAVNGG
jgi:hypothetical protein